LSAIYSALLTCYHTGLTLMASNSQAAKQCVCISAVDFAVLIQIQNLRSMVPEQTKFLGVFFDNKLTFLPHIRYLKEKCLKALNLLRVVAHTSRGADQNTLLHLYRSLVRSKLNYGSVVYGSARESYLLYVYWIRYKTPHCGYASVPSEPHLPQVCVFKPMKIHSKYGEEC